MDEETQGIDMGRYIGLVLRWWWIIAAAVVLFAALAYVYSTSTKSTVYTAKATILIQESRSGLAPGFGDVQASRELTRTYQELLTTSHLLQLVIDELGLSDRPEDLRDQVNVSVRSGTPLMDVEVRRGDLDSPALIANTLTQVFIQDRQTTRLAEIRRLEVAAEAQGIDTTSLRESHSAPWGASTSSRKPP